MFLRKYVHSLKGFLEEGIELYLRKCRRESGVADLPYSPAQSDLSHAWFVPPSCLHTDGIQMPPGTVAVWWAVPEDHHRYVPADPTVFSTACIPTRLSPLWSGAQSAWRQAPTLLHLGRLALWGLGMCCYVFSVRQLQAAHVDSEDIALGFLVHA